MNQLVTPNLSVTTYITRCLQYVQDAFASPNAGKSAWYSWNNRTLYRHTDKDFPRGVYFVVWFAYWGTVDGVYDNWGHVVIGKDGRYWSSPWKSSSASQNTCDIIESLSEVERIYGCTFVGWSEDIAGLKVIEGGSMSRRRIEPDVVRQNFDNFTNGAVKVKSTDPVCQNRWEDPESDEFWYGFMFQMKDILTSRDKEIADLKTQLSSGQYVKVTDLYIKK